MSTIFDTLYQQAAMHASASLYDRLDFLTHYFLGKPYILGAQGEGDHGEFDQFPLYRFDGFDCVTFVNNSVALAISSDETSFKNNLLKMNYYDGKPLFQNRFHFMSLDWNPENQKNLLTDITEIIVDKNHKSIAEFAEGIIDKPNWFLHRSEKDIRLNYPNDIAKTVLRLRDLSKAFQPQFVRMPYLPLQALLENPEYFDQFPRVSIIEIVRPNWNLHEKIGTNLHVSHVGFGLRLASGDLVFRHASSEQKGVVEILLKEYLRNCLKNETIKGIHIQFLKNP